jgi:hypothetical protein
MSVMAGVMTYVWPFATTKGSLIAVALLYGYADESSPIIHIGRNAILTYIISLRIQQVLRRWLFRQLANACILPR